ncbi:MAG: cation-translocating P-type ATPase [Rubrivivax sp.]|nr:cation-translocating P-type ATPase [Rubrivivax sp.]
MNTALADPAFSSEPPAVVDDPVELDRFTRWETSAEEGRVGVSSLLVSGMYCAACAGTIEDALKRVPGVLEARVNPASHRASVRWNAGRTRASALLSAVQAVGYGAVPDAAAPAREQRRMEHRAVIWRLFVGSFLAMQVMMLATPSYVADPGDLAPDHARLLNWGSWLLSIPVLWFGGMPFFAGAWAAIRRRRIAMDVPVALGLAVTFIASTGATFHPGGVFGHEVYFDSLTMFIGFLWFGRWLELRARHRAADELESALAGMPATAWRVHADGSVEEVALARLAPGDRLRVPAGGAVPADGVLLTEAAGVGEALLTGESQPVAKRAGDALLAGSVNVVAPLEMRVERVGADTRHEAIVALMREALSQRPASARLADRIAGPFLWVVLFLAVGSALAWLAIDPSRAVWVAVSVLIVTCPCALSLATPATLVATAGGLASRGVLLRHLDALQTVAHLRQVFLDKTGTLTLDQPVLADTRVAPREGPPMTADEVLVRAAGLAQWSSHPYSRALVSAAQARGLTPSAGWAEVQELPGSGLGALDESGRAWRLGSFDWALEGRGSPNAGSAGAVWLSAGGEPVASFRFDEHLRDDAQQAVEDLRHAGLQLQLLSGDDLARAQAVGARLGIEQVQGGASPESKLALLQSEQQRAGPVAMVGDGINDAPVMAAADVAVAMGHAALAAQQGADAVIVSGRLSALVDLHRSARRCMAIIRQNLMWAAVYNAACIPLAMAGWLPPWAAGLGMALSSVLVVLNAQRAR